MSARIVVICAVALTMSWAANAQMSQADAFAAGQGAGSEDKRNTMFQGINQTQGSQLIRGFSETPPAQSSYWTGNETQLNNLLTGGTAKISECATTGLNSSDPAYKQHCEAVDSIMKGSVTRPTNLLSPSDPLILRGRAISANPEAIAGAIDGNYSDCTTTTRSGSPPTFSVETCNDWSELLNESCKIGTELVIDPHHLYQCKESLSLIKYNTCTYGQVVNIDVDYNYQCNATKPSEIQKCRRGFSPEFGSVVESQSFAVNRGSEVPNYAVRTFTMSFVLDGAPENVRLTFYQVDNYGQLWVNGVLVYQNLLGGMPSDIRNSSYVTTSQYNPANNTTIYINGFQTPSGFIPYTVWDDGCNWGCKGVYPNFDLTPYLAQGNNTIELSCINANSIGPCAINIVGNVRKLVMIGSLVNNGCAALQRRAQ